MNQHIIKKNQRLAAFRWPSLVFIFLLFQPLASSVDCPVTIGDLSVLENPVNVPKTANRKITTLQIKEEQHLGSLTCHVFRHTSHPIFDKFNATTQGLAFANAGTYDPYNFGKKLQRFYNCDIYLTDANFEELVVDLEVVLILQPLIRRRPGINNCDQPLITRQTVRIEFEGYQSTKKPLSSSSTSRIITAASTRQPFIFTTILRRTSFRIEKVPLSQELPPLQHSISKPSGEREKSSTRQPKVVQQFAATKTNREEREQNYVDGFNVGSNEGIPKATTQKIATIKQATTQRTKATTSRSTLSTKRKEIRNVDLSNQGTTTNRPAAILQEEESSGTNSVLGAGPGIKGGTTKNDNENPLLFWVILGIVLFLAFFFSMAVIYYCCPALCVPCFGDGYLNKSLTGGVGMALPGPLGTAKDLTFVSVLDKNGRPLQQASSVEVWNTHKNNIRTYPIIGGKKDPVEKFKGTMGTDNYAVFTNQTGHLQQSHGPRDFILTGPDDPEPMESGDRVTLVDQTGKESPVLVRILRAVTPRTFSARLARSRWGSRINSRSNPSSGLDLGSGSDGDDSRPPRIFEIVRESPPNGGPETGVNMHKSRHLKDVQIMTLEDGEDLDHSRGETFRREGGAEILELDQGSDTTPPSAGMVEEELQSTRARLEVLDEAEEENVGENEDQQTVKAHSTSTASVSPADEELIRSELASMDSNANEMQNSQNGTQTQLRSRKESEQQTDLTYGHVNKKVQANTMDDEDQNSDVDDMMADQEQETDVDAASSVLSQSLRSSHSYNGGDPTRYYRYGTGINPNEEVGFLNVAMHRLVQDELLGRGAAQAAQAAQTNRSRLSQFRGGPGGQQYHRANGVASSALSGPKRRSRSQADYMSDGSERYIVTHRKKHKKRSDGNINYYDGNRTPPSPAYNETKASILRRRKNYKPNENEEEDLDEVLRPVQPTVPTYSSLQDLSRLQQEQGVPFSKHQAKQKPSTKLIRQNSEPLTDPPLGLSI